MRTGRINSETMQTSPLHIYCAAMSVRKIDHFFLLDCLTTNRVVTNKNFALYDAPLMELGPYRLPASLGMDRYSLWAAWD